MAIKECTEKDIEILKETKNEKFSRYKKSIDRRLMPNYYYTILLELPEKSVVKKRIDKNFIARKYSVNVTLKLADDDYWKDHSKIPSTYFITTYQYFIDVTVNDLSKELGADNKLVEYMKNKYILSDTIILGSIIACKLYYYKGEKARRSNKTEIFNILSDRLSYSNGKLTIGNIGSIEIDDDKFDEKILTNSEVIRFRYNHKTKSYYIDFGKYEPIKPQYKLHNVDNDEYVLEEIDDNKK